MSKKTVIYSSVLLLILTAIVFGTIYTRNPNTFDDILDLDFCINDANVYAYDSNYAFCDTDLSASINPTYFWNNTPQPAHSETINSATFGVYLNCTNGGGNNVWEIKYGFATTFGTCTGITYYDILNDTSDPCPWGFQWFNVTNITAVTWENINNTCWSVAGDKVGGGDDAELWIDVFHVTVDYSAAADSINPDVVINNPTPADKWWNSTILINATVTDNVKVNDSGIFYWLEQAGTNKTAWTLLSNVSSGDASYFNATFDTSTISDGTYSVRINASDNSTNENSSETVQLFIDNNAPDIQQMNVNQSSANTNTLIKINISVVETNINSTWGMITQSDGNISNVTLSLVSGTWYEAIVPVGSSAGTFWFNTSYVNDSVGQFTINNTPQSVSVSELDLTSPNVTINNPTPADKWWNSTILINATVTDNIKVNDSGVFYWLEQAGVNQTAWTLLSNTSSGDASYFNVTFVSTSVSDGSYDVRINASDNASNYNTSETVQLFIDNTAPDIQQMNVNQSTAGPGSLIKINISVVESYVNATWAMITQSDGNVTNVTLTLVSGTWYEATVPVGSTVGTFWFNTSYVNDSVGQFTLNNTPQSISITESVPPNVTINNPINGTNYSGNIVINATIVDNVNVNSSGVFYWLEQVGVNKTAWTLLSNTSSGDASYFNATFVSSSVSDGSYDVRINASDNSVNENTSEFVSITIDNTVSLVGIVSPIQDTNVSNGFLLNVSVNDSTSGAQTVKYWLENSTSNVTEWKDTALGSGTINQGFWNVTVDEPSLSDGYYNITINATDYTGNENSSVKVQIRIDSEAPLVGILSPQTGQNVSNSILINTSVNDTILGIITVQYWFSNSTDNVTAWTSMSMDSGTITQGYWNASFSTNTISDGNYNITINATDYAGNENSSVKVEVTVDNNRPSAGVITPQIDANISTAFLLNTSINDSGTGVNTAVYRIENASGNLTAWTSMSMDSGTINIGFWNATVSVSSLSDGYYNISLNATDFAGKENSTVRSQFSIDKTNPLVGIVGLVNGQNYSSVIVINASVNDSTSGALTSTFRFSNGTGNVTAWTSMSLTSGTINIGFWTSNFNTNTLSNGLYNITINATDYADNENSSAKIEINISNIAGESVPPNVTINNPINGTNYSGSFVVNATVVDNVKVNDSGVFYWLKQGDTNSTPWTAMSNISSGSPSYFNATFVTTSVSDGDYNVTINASDNSTNENSSEFVTITIDNTVPNIVISLPTENQNLSITTIWVNGTIIDVHKLDNNPTINDTSFSLNNYDSGTGTFSFKNNTQLNDGTISVTVSFTDDLGNSNTSSPRSFVLDNTNPITGFVQPALNQNFSSNFLVNVSANDTTTGVNYTKYWIENSTGNLTQWIDMSMDSGTINQGYWNATIDISSLSDGLYNITINSSDFAGNTNTSTKREFRIDTTNPLVGILEPTLDKNVSGNMLINVSVNDSGTGVLYVYNRIENSTGNLTAWTLMTEDPVGFWKYTLSTATLVDGYYNVSINATDYAGSENSSVKQQFQIDNILPYVNIIEPTENQNISTNEITINGTITDTNKNQSNPQINDTGFSLSSYNPVNGDFTFYNTSSISDGTVTVNISFIDDAGNSNSSLRTFIVDNTASLVGIISPIQDSNVSSSFLLNVSVNDSTTGALTVQYWLENGSGNQTAWKSTGLGSGTINQGYWNTTVNEPTLAGGLYNITINATDYAGNENSSIKVQIEIDIEAPLVGILSPQTGQNVSNSILINASVNDSSSGTLTVQFYFENGSGNVTAWTTMSMDSGTINIGFWNASFNTNTISDGMYNITINATDYVGNENTTQKVEVTVDNDRPNPGVIVPQIDANISADFLLNASVNDSGTGVSTVVYRIENASGNVSAWTAMSMDSGTINIGFWNATVSISSLSDGYYNISLNATDFAGKENSSVKSQFIVDKTKPSVGIETPSQNQNISGAVTINASVNDSTSGVKETYFWLENGSGNVTAWTAMSMDSGTINQGFWNASFNTDSLTNGLYNITINATDFVDNENSSTKVQINVIKAAYVTDVDVFPNSPLPTQDLNCSWNASSDGNSNLTANVTWYNDGVNEPAYNSTNISCEENKICYATVLVDSSSTSAGEVWICSVTTVNNFGESASANASETIQSSGGGPGGGGGGGGFRVKKEKIEKHYIHLIEKGAKGYIQVNNKKDFKIIEVEILAKNTMTGVEFILDQEIPSPEFSEDLGTLYSYVDLSTNASRDLFSAALISFRVEKEWLSEEDFSSEMVYMLKKAEQEWQGLPTLKLGEDDNFSYHATITHNFSLFAIAASSLRDCSRVCPSGQVMNPFTCECQGSVAGCEITCPQGTLLDTLNCVCIMPTTTIIERGTSDYWSPIIGALAVIVLGLLILFLSLKIKILAKQSGVKMQPYERKIKSMLGTCKDKVQALAEEKRTKIRHYRKRRHRTKRHKTRHHRKRHHKRKRR